MYHSRYLTWKYFLQAPILRSRSCNDVSIRNLTSVAKASPPLAFVFDIDGVLLRGPDVLPTARRAFNILEGNNPFQKKIPYILLTNGGGIAEHDRCHKLSAQLGIPIHPEQYCQAHTILKKYYHKYSDLPVLVLGGKLDNVRQVAKEYGYQKAYTTLDVLAWNPSAWPFHTLSDAERAITQPVDFSKTPISAIFVYHDPRNWALDIQVICDVIQSAGIIGGQYTPISEQEKPVELVFCNPDLLWKSDFAQPRIGQGGFKVAFQAVYKALTGNEYPYLQYGKPSIETYKFASDILHGWIKELYGPAKQSNLRIFMVGDNPESDIAGANAAKWSSILVETGVYDPVAHGKPRHLPTHYAKNVEEAVKWAIDQEMQRCTKS
ncbi:HAD-superfamily hydrolase [Pholiota conissans]|uniref:HAD-superfamily hydrolase n=1 Tax=Pholiota conissans TaxID=109636 RepID=A0A9P5YXI1_9AGAR|nr:HAD-superfamily hydrolase [Pholiota conissans]